jgi:Mrp family chromosome partitioning ATPase
MLDLPIHYAEVEAIYNQTIGTGYRTIAITSAIAGEGKTTISQALVERAQLIGKKVLLVDMNTFNPALSNKLRAAIAQPLTENIIVNIKSKGYSLLPAPKNIRDVLHYREANLLIASINQWLEHFDCIIFDTSALTTLNQSNIPAEIICEACEGAILVVEAGKTPQSLIQESIEKFKMKKVNLIGSIINDKSNPPLLTELLRETYRLNQLFPKLMAKLRKKLSNIIVFNISI